MSDADIEQIAALLSSPNDGERSAVVEDLKSAYVKCDDEGCVTDAEVARRATPHVLQALASSDARARVAGASAAMLFADRGDVFVAPLTVLIQDDMPEVRLAALDALVEFGDSANGAAAEVFSRLAGAESAEERAAAVYALSSMSMTAVYLGSLLDHLVHDVATVQAAIANALAWALEDEDDGGGIREQVSAGLHRLRNRGRT